MEGTPHRRVGPIAYLKEAREELLKVTWPNRPTVIRYSLLAIGVSVIIAVFFAALDYGLNIGLQQLIAISE